jgi:hypothetical protein
MAMPPPSNFPNTEFLRMAHAVDERYTVRDGINVARPAVEFWRL